MGRHPWLGVFLVMVPCTLVTQRLAPEGATQSARSAARFEVGAEHIRLQGPRSPDVELRARGGGFTATDPESGVRIEARLVGATSAKAEVSSGSRVTFRGGHETGADVAFQAVEDGIEDLIHLDARPAVERIDYALDLGARVAGLRLVASTLELVDAGGAPRLRVDAPWIEGADGRRQHARLDVEGCAVDRDPRAPWGRPPVAPGSPHCRLALTWSDVRYPAVLDPAWTATSGMQVGRMLFDLVRLDSGLVLAAGGSSKSAVTELFDPSTGTWATTGSLTEPRSVGARSAKLADGTVLLVGGATTLQAALYDPTAGTWSPVGPMTATRSDGHTLTALPNGKALVVGGTGGVAASAEIYDATAKSFSALPAPNATRQDHIAVLLQTGSVLVAGGGTTSSYTKEAELFDPATETWSATGEMALGNRGAASVLLQDGRVLVSGACACSGDGEPAEIYDPTPGTWSVTDPIPVKGDRDRLTLSLLSNGQVLAAGGWDFGVHADCYLFPGFAAAADMNVGRSGHAAVPLLDGRVLVAGGQVTSGGGGTTSSELFAQAPLGGACTIAGDCDSGHCVDGVCCDTACSGQCQACTVAKGASKDGTCEPLPSTTLCLQESCTGATYEPAGSCDGAGACSVPDSVSCSPYACAASGCKTDCASTDDCAFGYECAGGTCKAQLGASCTGNDECASGSCQDGTCCTANGLCTNPDAGPQKCTGDQDCPVGWVCAVGKCFAPSSGTPDAGAGHGSSGGGCGCRAAGGREGSNAQWLLLGLLGLGVLSRRRRARGGAAVLALGIAAFSNVAHAAPTQSPFQPIDVPLRAAIAASAVGVGFDGSTSMLFWTKSSDLYAVRQMSDGTLIAGGTMIESPYSSSVQDPTVVWAGGMHVVAYREGTDVKVLRVAPDGTPIQSPYAIDYGSSSYPNGSPRVATDGYLTAIVWRSKSPGSVGVNAKLFAPDRTAKEVTIDDGNTVTSLGEVAVAYTGQYFVFAWDDGGLTLSRLASGLQSEAPTSLGDGVKDLWGLPDANGATFAWTNGPLLSLSTRHLDAGGTVVDSAVSSVPVPSSNVTLRAVFDGSDRVLGWCEANSAPRATALLADGSAANPTGFAVGAPGFCTRALGRGPKGLVQFRPNGELVDFSADGKTQDVTWVPDSKVNAESSPLVAYDGQNNLIVWRDTRLGGAGLYAARVGPKAEVLDAPAKFISALPSTADKYDVTGSPAGGFLVARATKTSVSITRIGADGTLVDTTPIELVSGTDVGAIRVAADPQGYLVTWAALGSPSTEIVGVHVPVSGAVSPSSGVPLLGPAGTEPAGAWALAYDGVGYQIVWLSSSSNALYEMKLDAKGVAVSSKVALGGVGTPAVDCGASVCLAVWTELGVDHGARIDAAGALLDAPGGFVVNAGPVKSVSAVSFSGSSFLVATEYTFEKRAVRVSPAGVVLDATPFNVAPFMSDVNPHGLSAAPNGWTITYDDLDSQLGVVRVGYSRLTEACENAADGAACDDGNPCTKTDVCNGGMCKGVAYSCSSSDACLSSQCTGDGGCKTVQNQFDCDDGNPCTSNDHCNAGTCVGVAYTCDAGDTCTAGAACDGKGGCQYLTEGAQCDDGQQCSSADACTHGVCVGDLDWDCYIPGGAGTGGAAGAGGAAGSGGPAGGNGGFGAFAGSGAKSSGGGSSDGGCGCRLSGRSSSLPWWLVGALFVLRRRRPWFRAGPNNKISERCVSRDS